ncbi:MAG: phosphoenolpyruvate carboxylase [Elusimicrobiota bacterium]
MPTHALPAELRALVRTVGSALGDTVRADAGPKVYRAVEAVRLAMTEFRGPAHRRFDRLGSMMPKTPSAERSKRAILDRAARILGSLSPKRKAALAKAYTLYLELANVCENAYRTHRLRQRRAELGTSAADVIYVLTAHPTESRSPKNIALLKRINNHLVHRLAMGPGADNRTLSHLLCLLWKISTHPPHKPTVEDEARHLATLLSDDIIDELLTLKRRGHRVLLRTWVGGDKDGHPGVGPDQLQASLQETRSTFAEYLRRRLEQIRADLDLAGGKGFLGAWRGLKAALEAAATIRARDGARIAELARAAARASAVCRRLMGMPHPFLEDFRLLLELFPGLALPLELREERGRFGRGSVIASMLARIRTIADGGEVGAYVRGLVISMAGSAADLETAAQLVRRIFGGPKVPVIPLFELPEILPLGAGILEEAARLPAFRSGLQSRRGQEVMLGYSDTAKRMGSLPSRLAIHDAMAAIGKWGKREKIRIIFFHGAGGSEGRGGGTISEQAASWPRGALRPVKITLQGEMVERTFSSPEILRSQVLKVAKVQKDPPNAGRISSFTRELAEAARSAYEDLIGRQELLDFVANATPYTRLSTLNIGSRPVKREGSRALEDLRAIPWVLCWTQTRHLLPVWYGLGSAWRALREKGGSRGLRRTLRADPLLRGFMRVNAFALSKGAPRIFRRYAKKLAPESPSWLMDRLEREWLSAASLAKAASGKELLEDRRWLKESIYYRAPMIHPLNLLQIELLARKSWDKNQEMLFRETVTGIAAGMLTTG